MKFDWTQGALAEGLRRYYAGAILAAHEAWESVWLESQESEKTFLQGLIQVTAAFHHLLHNIPRETALLLQAALGRLNVIPRASEVSPSPCSESRELLHLFETRLPTPNSIPSEYVLNCRAKRAFSKLLAILADANERQSGLLGALMTIEAED